MRVQIERYLEDLDLGFAEDTWHMLRALQGVATEW